MDIDFAYREDVIYEKDLIENKLSSLLTSSQSLGYKNKWALKLKELEYREKDLTFSIKERELALRERETKIIVKWIVS
ncbi:unnamed protein product [Rhizophagus irregularis]|nr:unnamed protein product [Rhizophagus irregularis]CAB5347253.1 unnamed protein product [Rhizophagus irregularis]